MELDQLTPLLAQVGYGRLGVRGDLGYEAKRVTAQGRRYASALSSHPPARLIFRLGGQYQSFACQVGLNDDVPVGRTHADFLVLADGRQVASAPFVRAGEPPRSLIADVRGAQQLELVVGTARWQHCHAVWLDPQLSTTAAPAQDDTLVDCLGRCEIVLPLPPPKTRRCIATVASAGFDGLLDDMLGSLVSNGGCRDARVFVFALGDDIRCAEVAAKYRATLIRCTPRARVNSMSKALLYSAARVIDAESFVCLDADMLILDDLGPVFGAIEAAAEGSIFACREANDFGFNNIAEALERVYGGRRQDFARVLPPDDPVWKYPLTVNDGIFAAGRGGMLALDGAVRGMIGAAQWSDARRDMWWRNQFVFNLALARLGCGVELDSTYNVQLNSQNVELRREASRVRASWRGRSPRVLHLNGLGRNKYPDWKGLFARVPDPMPTVDHYDGYEQFLTAVRAWVGQCGLSALAWSFYGTSDGDGASVRDSATMPLFATLHYLIRSNGCVRVLECGTGRGVSTACIASAVAHRDGGRVVTMDPYVPPERQSLWETLPEALNRSIEARAIGSIEGMSAALETGERYDAALLDSIHTEEQVWAEFALARRLVQPGGLILVHDARLRTATVNRALERIEASGYNVVRLWSAEGRVPEDDDLGLALIENRLRPDAATPNDDGGRARNIASFSGSRQ